VIFEQQPPVRRQPSVEVVVEIWLKFSANRRAGARQIFPDSIAGAFELPGAYALLFHCFQSFFQAIFRHRRPPV
jgi:hypothetical protein